MSEPLWSDERIDRAVGAADFRHYEDDLAAELLRTMRDEYERDRESKNIALGMLYGDINNLKLRIAELKKDELEAAWPPLPDDLEGIDRFSQYEITGDEQP